MIKDEFGGWMFDLDEREALTDILKDKFDSKQIYTLLILLREICFYMKIWKEDLPSNQDVKLYVTPILNSINKTNDYLHLLEKKQLANGIPFGFPYFLGSDPHPQDKRHIRHFDRHIENIRVRAEASRNSLEELQALIEKQLQEWKMLPHRPKADSHSFVYDMVKRYLQIFHEIPTAYPDGIFFKIVQKTREIVGMKFEDPRKSIEAALKKHRLNGTLEIKS